MGTKTEEQLSIINKLKEVYSVRNIKTFRGMEGSGVNSTLYKDGKKACTVDDEGSGGCLLWGDWNFQTKLNLELGKVGKIACDGFDLPYDADFFVEELISDALLNKEYKRKCKKKTLIITKDCKEDGQYIQINFPYSQRVKPELEKRYGDKLVEIINERFI